MLLAAQQTIGYRFLQLPHSAQPFLKCLGILELGNLLELVDTHNDVAAFLLRDFFRKLQNLIHIVALGIHLKRNGEICHRICTH